LSGDTGVLVFEISKGAVAFGNQEQRFESSCLLRNVVYETHQIGLRWKISDPNGVTWSNSAINDKFSKKKKKTSKG
jgi:hypothetical protein